MTKNRKRTFSHRKAVSKLLSVALITIMVLGILPVTVVNAIDEAPVYVENSYSGTTGAGTYAPGQTVTIDAGTHSGGLVFSQWMVLRGNITLDNPTSDTTSFTMTDDKIVSVIALWGNTTMGQYVLTIEPPATSVYKDDLRAPKITRHHIGVSIDGKTTIELMTETSNNFPLSAGLFASSDQEAFNNRENGLYEVTGFYPYSIPGYSPAITAPSARIIYITFLDRNAFVDNFTIAQELVNTAIKGEDPGQYPATAYDEFMSAFIAAYIFHNTPATDVTLTEIDTATSDLISAIEAFQKSQVGAPTTNNESSPSIIVNAPAGMMFEDGIDFFEAYKIFDVTFSGDNYSYVLVDAFKDFDDYPGSDHQTLKEYLDSMPSAEEMTELAAALHNYIYNGAYDPWDWAPTRLADPVGDIDIKPNKATIDLDVPNGGYGYYMVFHSIGAYPEWYEWDEEFHPYADLVAACILTTTDPVANVNAKIDVPTIEKFIVNKDSTYTKNQGFSVGEEVFFAIEVTLPSSFEGYDEYTFIVHDVQQTTHQPALGIINQETWEIDLFESFSVSIWEKGQPSTKTPFPSTGYELTQEDYDFSIEFDFSELLNIPDGYSLLIEYSAITNNSFYSTCDHLHGWTGEYHNMAYIEFSGNLYDLETMGYTPETSVRLFSGNIDDHIRKVDGASYNEEYDSYYVWLFDAEFSLSRLTERDTPGANGLLYDLEPIHFIKGPFPGSALYDGRSYEYLLDEDEETYYELVFDTIDMLDYARIDIWSIGPGLYMLKEVKAPNGFNIMTYNVFLEIEFNYGYLDWMGKETGYFVYKVYFDKNNDFLYNSDPVIFDVFCDISAYDHSSENPEEWTEAISKEVSIENFSGTLFPGTGGPGTAIFYATSLLLTFGIAIFYMTTRKRKVTSAN